MAQLVKNLPAMRETWVQSLGWADPLEKGKPTHSSILAWEFHGQRSLVGYSPWGCKESDTTEQLTFFAFTFHERFPSLVAQVVKNLPAMRETSVRFLGWEVPLEKG